MSVLRETDFFFGFWADFLGRKRSEIVVDWANGTLKHEDSSALTISSQLLFLEIASLACLSDFRCARQLRLERPPMFARSCG